MPLQTTMSEIQQNATPMPTSKYDEERKSLFDSINEKNAAKEDKAKKDNDYTIMFNNEYDKVKADSNNDGKIDYNEYKSYVVSNHEAKPSILQSHMQEDNNNNNNTNQNYYHFDYSLLIAIGMVCITTIIVSWIKK